MVRGVSVVRVVKVEKVIKGFEKKKIAKTLFGVPRATFDPKRERLIGP